MIDGSTFRLPRIGVYTNKNVNMDKQGVLPDVAIETNAEEWAKGVDAQIAKAVQVLTTDVVAWKTTHNPSVAAAPATESKPTTPAPPEAKPALPTTESKQPTEPSTVKPKGSGEPAATKKPPARKSIAPHSPRKSEFAG